MGRQRGDDAGTPKGEPTVTLAIVLHPLPASPGRYAARHGDRVLCRSRQPFFDAGRALLAGGSPPETALEARHTGSDIVAMRSTVGEAAKWTIEERDRGGMRRIPWKPHPRAAQDADCSYARAPEIERGDEGRGILPPEPPPAFSGAPQHASDDFASDAKRARE
jgi:hypothetical protein